MGINKLTAPEVRMEFWRTMFPEIRRHGVVIHGAGRPTNLYGMSHNELPADIRVAFCNFIDQLEREGSISEELAQSITLDRERGEPY